jgi:hypothetical protein
VINLSGRINEIYQSYINSAEFEKKAKEAEIDISWLEEILSQEELLKLEESITKYYLANGKLIFEGGFFYAWDLFTECANKGKNEDT